MKKATSLSGQIQGALVSKIVRRGLLLFLILLLYDGAMRKWLFPGIQQYLFVAKDFLLSALLAYAVFLRPRRAHFAIPPYSRMLLMFYAVWVILECANQDLPNYLVGIWGVKAHLLYAGLILLLPLAFADLDDVLNTVVRIYPWAVIPVCSLAFLQITFPADSFINHQVTGGLEMIAQFGEASLVRVSGTFSYITGMADFVEVTSVLGLALFVWGVRSRPFLVAVGFSLAALPATGSRAVIVIVGASAVLLMFGGLFSRLINRRMALRTLVTIMILAVVSLQLQDAAWEALQQRTINVVEGGDDSARAVTAFTNAFKFFDVAGLTGFGTGSANYGAVALAHDVPPFSWLPPNIYMEEESGRLVLELGIVGWALSLAMRLAFLLWSIRLGRRGGTREIRAAGLIALPVMAQGFYLGNGVFAPPVGASWYWFCVGLMAVAHYEQRRMLVGKQRAVATPG